MLIPALVSLLKYKVISSIVIFASFSAIDQVKLAKQLSQHGIAVSFASDPAVLAINVDHTLQGVLYVKQDNNSVSLEKIHKEFFSNRYKWILISDEIPAELNHARYDSDIIMFQELVPSNITQEVSEIMDCFEIECKKVELYDVYVHPRDGVTLNDWASWSTISELAVTHDRERTLRRRNLKQYPFRISAPVAHYSEETYNGTFAEYLVDLNAPDSGLRCGYGASSLLIEMVNATKELRSALLWNSDVHNSSMILMLETGEAELSAGVLRLMKNRVNRLDYVMPIWLFSVGFTYLAERESSSNMYVEPFSAGVWWTCLLVGVVLAVAQRLTSRRLEEKESALMSVLATCLQQDANAVPCGLSGRWTFTVLSGCSMLVHAYYTSAIVSALMSTGRGGPQSLRALADSRYAIASEDHDFIRYTMFDVETNWEDLEYLKKRKLTSKFYQDIEYGVQLVRQGYTAYHAEYHQLYPYLNTLSDDDICKMQHVDTIPEVMTWITATPRGQWTNLLRSSGVWLQETGLAKRLITQMQVNPPPCRAALLAERVAFGDVAPLLAVTASAAVFSFCLLGLEKVVAKWSLRHKTKIYSRNEMPYEEGNIM